MRFGADIDCIDLPDPFGLVADLSSGRGYPVGLVQLCSRNIVDAARLPSL
ncbi:hypothetical protein EMEDMD4_1330026 [Sinorhizobium medicae]|uniref:Uncharacterized protein n=1 Tax=Sinorhizobium medicae TaxID=110321 RepID=A0A508WRK2_9HYPH|nr:hypothetical protein EMEDMD4_1330026 [Sinorhizobium medicae]